jgi:hypothetical protein
MPLRWITYEQTAGYYSKNMVAWSVGQTDNILHGGTQQSSGQQSILTFNSIIAVKGLSHKNNKRYTNPPLLNNKALFRRDKNVCGYCGDTFTSSKLTRDHIIPTSKGGQDIWTNVVTSCMNCNSRKGHKILESVGMELLYVPYTPCHNEYLILLNRNVLADQLSFLQQRITNKNSRFI